MENRGQSRKNNKNEMLDSYRQRNSELLELVQNLRAQNKDLARELAEVIAERDSLRIKLGTAGVLKPEVRIVQKTIPARKGEKRNGENLGLEAQQAVAALIRTHGPMKSASRDITWDRAYHIVGGLAEEHGLETLIEAADWLMRSLGRFTVDQTRSFLAGKIQEGGEVAAAATAELAMLDMVFRQSVDKVGAQASVPA
jgi:hypothetical protein